MRLSPYRVEDEITLGDWICIVTASVTFGALLYFSL